MTDALWRRGFELARFGLALRPANAVVASARSGSTRRRFPDTQIILNHTGLPADRGAEGIDGWKRAMTALAACPNVAVKISGIGVPGKAWTADANRAIVLTVIDLFGAQRCMFASNFPVDSLCATFGEIFGGFRAIVADFTAADQRRLFRDNAMRIYAMEETHATAIGYVGVGLMGLPMVKRLTSAATRSRRTIS